MAAEGDSEVGEGREASTYTSPRPTTRGTRGRRGQRPHAEGARTGNACQNCRQKKVKCDGEEPCRFCSKRSLSCVFSAAEKRKMYSISEVRELKAKVARYEGSESRTRQGSAEAMNGSANSQDEATANEVNEGQVSRTRTPQSGFLGPATPKSTLSPQSQSQSQVHAHSHYSTAGPPVAGVTPAQTINWTANIAPESALSSSDAFGSEVRTLLGLRYSGGWYQDTPAATCSSLPPLGRETLDQVHDWPSEEEAHELLEWVVLHVGISQQLFDVRSFSDNLSRIYHDSSPGEQDLSDLWYVEALLVMAIGRLLRGRPDNDSPSDVRHVPGDSFYTEAMKRLPRLGVTGKHGIIGIEVVALAALYLQIADRKEEAYLYASMALRLAIRHGLHKKIGALKLRRSDAVHRNRLWWSVYMQERRLAAAGGYPIAIHDKAVTIESPTDASGFPSAASISVNVRAARITGQITSTIYSYNNSSETSFISEVQNILHSLHEVKSTMPAEYLMNLRDSPLTVAGRPFSQLHPHTARTSASLYLSIYQAVMHAVRPVLLYMARSSRDSETEAYNDLSPAMRRLAEICVEAASKCLLILQELRNREIIARNVFLDLDAVFSAGFVFVLVEVINRGKNLGKSGIDGSRSILRYLDGLGNRAAAKRLAELDQMCAHLETPHNNQMLPSQEPPADVLTENFSFEFGYVNPESIAANTDHGYRDTAAGSGSGAGNTNTNINTTYKETGRAFTGGGPDAGEQQHRPGQTCSSQDDAWLNTNTDLADISLEGENGLFGVFQPGFYTGAELTDWEILEMALNAHD